TLNKQIEQGSAADFHRFGDGPALFSDKGGKLIGLLPGGFQLAGKLYDRGHAVGELAGDFGLPRRWRILRIYFFPFFLAASGGDQYRGQCGDEYISVHDNRLYWYVSILITFCIRGSPLMVIPIK